MKKSKDIDFNNKEIVATEYHFYFSQKDRPEGWTIEDELMMLSLYLQREIVSREALFYSVAKILRVLKKIGEIDKDTFKAGRYIFDIVNFL